MRKLTACAVILAVSLISAMPSQAELNWKSEGTPSVSCEVTKAASRFLFFGEWTDIDLTYYVTEEPSARLYYKCAAKVKSDSEGSYTDPKHHECLRMNSSNGSGVVYNLTSTGDAEIRIAPGVNKLDVCYRLSQSAGIKAVKK
jgi:hypothetical protein